MVDLSKLSEMERVVLSAFFDSEGNHYEEVCNTSPSVIKARDYLVSAHMGMLGLPAIAKVPMRFLNEMMRRIGYNIESYHRKGEGRIKAKPQLCYVATLNRSVKKTVHPLSGLQFSPKFPPKLAEQVGLITVPVTAHPDDKAALLEYAFKLRAKRGMLTTDDNKRIIDDFIAAQQKEGKNG